MGITDKNNIFLNKTILAAEDDEMNREILSFMLDGTGIAIDFAIDGKIAVDMFNADPQKYGLILMDINMPQMSGTEASSRIRADGGWGSKVPIIAMTAGSSDDYREERISSGMNDYVGKPINMGELTEKLKKYLT
jgi:CheY-like chemotaxis protein